MYKIFLAVFIGITTNAFAESMRPMETVVTLSAEQAEMILGDVGEPVMMISSKDAAMLLGDEMDLRLDQINNMPATAAGLKPVIYISPENAAVLLDDN